MHIAAITTCKHCLFALTVKESLDYGDVFSKQTYLEFDAFIVYLYYLSVMLERLPEFIDPLQLADKRGELKGQMPLKNLDRLADMLFDDAGTVAVELFFSREGRLAKIEGQLLANLQLICQNCLQAVAWPLALEVKLGIVTSIDQADRLPENYEPLVVEEGKTLLKTLVEDEILLVLPIFPKHAEPCAIPAFNTNNIIAFAGNEPSAPENPFSILAKLKHTGDL